MIFNLKISNAQDRAILCLGDSLTAGSPGFRSPIEHRPNGLGDKTSQYAFWLGKYFPEVKIYNEGVAGQRSDQIARRFDGAYERLKPNILILLAGTNDVYQDFPLEHTKRYIKEIVYKAKERKMLVLLCSIPPYNIATEAAKIKMVDLNEWISRYAQEEGLLFCDIFKILNNPKNPHTLISTTDEIHPDVSGYKMMADALAKALQDKLEDVNR